MIAGILRLRLEMTISEDRKVLIALTPAAHRLTPAIPGRCHPTSSYPSRRLPARTRGPADEASFRSMRVVVGKGSLNRSGAWEIRRRVFRLADRGQLPG